MTLEELQKIYKREAKRADQRMRELERATAKKEYKNILKWAYAAAQDNLTALFGENVTRFDRKIDNKRKLNKALSAVRAFLNSETSTIGKGVAINGVGETRGINELLIDRTNKFNAWMKANTDKKTALTPEQFHDFVENEKYQKLRKKYKGSDVILRRIGSMAKNKRKLKKMIAEEQNRVQSHITDIDMYNYILEKMEKDGLSAAADLIK